MTDIGAEISYELPIEASSKFAKFFEEMDSLKNELGLNTYGVSVTTLEDVFLKVAQGDFGKPKKNNDDVAVNNEKDNIIDIEENKEEYDLKSIRMTSQTQIFIIHLIALFKKRLWYFSRDKKGLVCEIVLPILVVIFGL